LEDHVVLMSDVSTLNDFNTLKMTSFFHFSNGYSLLKKIIWRNAIDTSFNTFIY